jgi:hypothetical protein
MAKKVKEKNITNGEMSVRVFRPQIPDVNLLKPTGYEMHQQV